MSNTIKTVLVTGASGLVGSRLLQMLNAKGYVIRTLGRKKQKPQNTNTQSFVWDVEAGYIEEGALEGVDAIIHLAGAGVADSKWTAARKREILDSRVQSTQLLFHTLQKMNHHIQVIVSASAVGYYGDCGPRVVTEVHPVADTYLADVCKQWEDNVARFSTLGIREVRCRIGIVLAKNGGALPELTKTLPLGVAGYFAKADLYYPWIHLDDVCGIMIHALENENMKGAYNTTSDNPVVLKDLMSAILQAKNSKALLLPAPPFALQMAMGEMADMLLSSQRCTAKKVMEAGYRFYYPDLKQALQQIYRS